jgi:hypothetical protein
MPDLFIELLQWSSSAQTVQMAGMKTRIHPSCGIAEYRGVWDLILAAGLMLLY